MTKPEALKLIVESKATSPSTRNFVAWLYRNGYEIISDEEEEELIGIGKDAAYFNCAFGSND